ncbi:MAG: hypothetical protein OXK82_04030 [Deltaproteobacteria bacterium]|nr:hypothetical protein [Deltaproteobacteria bacterium]
MYSTGQTIGVWASRAAATSVLALVVSFAAAAIEPASESTRYLEQSEREIRAGNYEAAANALDLVLAYFSRDGIEPPSDVFMRHAEASFLAGRHAAAATSATRYLLAEYGAAGREQEALDLVRSAETALADQRNARWQAQARETHELAQRSADSGPRESENKGTSNEPSACEIPGYPYPDDVENLGLDWCPSMVDFQVRVFALQAAGAWCAIRSGSSSTPEQIEARHQEIGTTCDRLDAFAGRLTDLSCRCPSGYRP